MYRVDVSMMMYRGSDPLYILNTFTIHCPQHNTPDALPIHSRYTRDTITQYTVLYGPVPGQDQGGLVLGPQVPRGQAVLSNFNGSKNCMFMRRIAKTKGELVNYRVVELNTGKCWFQTGVLN